MSISEESIRATASHVDAPGLVDPGVVAWTKGPLDRDGGDGPSGPAGDPGSKGAALAPKKTSLPYIDGVRALAALFVLAGHTWFEPSNGAYEERWMNRLGLSYGHIAVDAFIVVSGLVIGLPIARNANAIDSVSAFFKRRMRRILPPYWAALALCIAFGLTIGSARSGTVWDNALPVTWQQSLYRFALLQDLPFHVGGGSIGYQLWSIAVEAHIYLLVPLLVASMRVVGPLATLLGATGLSIALYSTFPRANSLVHWYVPLFLMGAIAARICVQKPVWGAKLLPAGVVLLLVAGAAVVKAGHLVFNRNVLWFDLAFGLGVSAVLTGLYFHDVKSSILLRVLSQRWLVAIGGFSYSLYLIHPPILHALWMVLRELGISRPLTCFALLMLLSPVVLAASWLFHVAFERPFMKTHSQRVGIEVPRRAVA